MSEKPPLPVILTIDDEAVIRSSIRAYLEDYNYQVVEAENGKVGLEIYEKQKIDLMLIDLRMPEMDGLEVLEAIRKKNKDVPVIVVSGTGNISDVVDALRLGAWDYLLKPIDDMSILLHAVENGLERARLLEENKSYQVDLEKKVEHKTQELADINKRLRDVVETTKFLIDGKSTRESGKKLLEEFSRHMQSSGGSLYAVGEQGLELVYSIDGDHALKFIPFPLDDRCVLAKALREKTPFHIDDMEEQPDVDPSGWDKYVSPSCLVFPIMNSQKSIRAIVSMHDRAGSPYRNQDQEIGTILSSYAGEALEAVRARDALKKSEEFLIQAQKMEAIGTLAGGIAHDFNNILSAIVGYTDLSLFSDKCDSSIKKNLVHVKKASERARDLVRQILAFSRMDSSQESSMDISPIIKEALKLLRATIPSSISINRSVPTGIGKVMVDPTRVHQIIMNLCTNAVHAMQNQEGELSVEYLCQTREQIEHDLTGLSGDKFMRLSIGDTGIGMEQEVVGKIFDPYFTTKQKEEGTGLGLAVVHGIVNGCGGEIRVDSIVNKGTTFHIYFPCISQKDDTDPERKVFRLARGSETILFVDDEATLADMAKEMLESLGYKVHILTSSLDALNLIKEESASYDLLITDQTMPILSGVDLAQKAMQIRPDLPVILYTGYSAAINGNEARKVGIKEFMMKPLSMTRLSKVVRNVLDESSKEK